MTPMLLLVISAAAAGLLVAALAGRLLVRHGHDWTDAVAIEGIAAIGAIGWLQSYVSLRALALSGHEPAWEADTWPAVLDVFALVMGLAAVRARREGRPDRYAEVLAAIYSLAAIAGNVWTSLPDPVTVAVHGLPPLTMVVGWHWLLRRSAGAPSGEAAPLATADTQPDPSQPDSRNGSRPYRAPSANLDARVLRLVRGNPRTTWKVVRDRTGLSDAGAKRALTAARKKLLASSREAQAAGGA